MIAQILTIEVFLKTQTGRFSSLCDPNCILFGKPVALEGIRSSSWCVRASMCEYVLVRPCTISYTLLCGWLANLIASLLLLRGIVPIDGSQTGRHH